MFLRVEGDQTRATTIDGGDISKAATPVVYAADASDGSVKLRV